MSIRLTSANTALRPTPVLVAALSLFAFASLCHAGEKPSLRTTWDMPAHCGPFTSPTIQDLKEELRQTGYRLIIAIHPDKPPDSKGEYPPRDLYLINADGSGLRQLTNTPDQEERTPRVSPDSKWFTCNYGDFLADTRTFKLRPADGAYVWAPDSRRTVACEKGGITYTDMETGKRSKRIPVTQRVDILDMSSDGKWFIFEIRNYLGSEYTIDFMPAEGGDIRKMPNHPIRAGECHPAFSPDAKWMCWNSGESLSVRRFDPALPDGTDGKVVTLPKEKMGHIPGLRHHLGPASNTCRCARSLCHPGRGASLHRTRIPSGPMRSVQRGAPRPGGEGLSRFGLARDERPCGQLASWGSGPKNPTRHPLKRLVQAVTAEEWLR